MHYEYLNMFTDEMIDDLKVIMKSCSDNHLKADMYVKYLKDIGKGFTEVGCGTNIICMKYKDKSMDHVVFKFPLDPMGVEDNFNDLWLFKEIPEIAEVYETHASGMVSAQRRYKVFTSKSDVQRNYKKITKILNRLIDEGYLLVDVSPTMYLNYGKDDNGNIVIVDGSDIFKLQDAETIRCTQLLEPSKKGGSKLLDKLKRCDGKLKYDEDYKYLICKDCGHKYNPLELRKKFNKEVNLLKGSNYTTGLSDNEQNELDNLIKRRRGLVAETKNNKHYDAEEEEPEIIKITLPSENEIIEPSEEDDDDLDLSLYGKEDDDDDEENDHEDDEDDFASIFEQCDPNGCEGCINSDTCEKKADVKVTSNQQINRQSLKDSLMKNNESDQNGEDEEIKCEIFDGTKSTENRQRQYVTEMFIDGNNVLIMKVSDTDGEKILELLSNGELPVVVVDEDENVLSDREYQFVKQQ